MYLSKKVRIFMLQFYIDYLIKFYVCAFFYNLTVQNTCDFPKTDSILWRQDIYFVVDMNYVDESDAVMFTVKHTS